ncbi:MAG: DUF5050 domain-containing protein [Syntrophomonadaceae bacterium]
MKRSLLVVLMFAVCATVIMGIGSPAVASGDIKITVNGTPVVFTDVKPYVDDTVGRLYVPLAVIGEAFGADVSWDGLSSTVTMTLNSKIIKAKVDTEIVLVDGSQIVTDAPVKIKDGRLVVSAKLFGEALGFDVKWMPETNTVALSGGAKPEQTKTPDSKAELFYITPLKYVKGITPSDQSYRLYRVGNDGSGRKQLSQGMVLKEQVVGDWIYYFAIDYLNRNEEDHQNGDIYRMKKDGSEVQRINLGKTSSGSPMKAVDFCVANDWVYYIDDTYQSHRIWRVKADGSSNSQVSQSSCQALALCGNRLFYSPPWYDGKGLYSMNMDGSDIKIECTNELIETGHRDIEDITSRDGWLGYVVCDMKTGNYTYKLYNPVTKETMKTSSLGFDLNSAQLLGEHNGVYLLASQNVVVFKPGNNEPQTVISDNCTMAVINGNNLYYITAADNTLHVLPLS